MKMKITEALAELSLIDKKIDNKKRIVEDNMFRQDNIVEPFAEEGGQKLVVAKALQSIKDLEILKVNIRNAINMANIENTITIGETTMSIAEWLIFRREVYPHKERFMRNLLSKVATIRQGEYSTRGRDDNKPTVIVNIDDAGLNAAYDVLTEAHRTLDGQLSLKNATIEIDVP